MTDYPAMIEIPFGTRPTSDKMAILLNEVQAATATTKERQGGHWIGIHNKHLRRLLGGAYRQVVQEAIDEGYLEVNERYSQRRFTKSYRLAKGYRTPQVRQYITKRLRSKERIRLDQQDETGHLLASWFDSAFLPTGIRSRGWDLYAVRSIQRRTWYAVRCPYRRFHSTFTGLPKRIRQRLKLNGKQVVECDVRNCQPLILGILTAQHQTTNTPYTIWRTKPDLRRYLEVCSAGRLYEHLLDCSKGARLHKWIPPSLRHRYGVDRPIIRQDVKRQFLTMTFADNETTVRLPLFRIVAREFPSVAEFILEAKRIEYQDLAKRCQRFESSIMIDGVAAELAQRFPVVTVHDSLVVAEENGDSVADSIKSRFLALGVDATIQQGFSNTSS